MSKPDYTHLVLILDASGSMSGSRSTLSSSVIKFLNSQGKEKNAGDLTVSLNIFNSSQRSFFVHFLTAKEAADYIRSHYYTSGGTPLYDAVGLTASAMHREIVSLHEEQQPEKVIVVTVTDGQESAGSSREYTAKHVAELVNHYEDNYSWEFLYVGSNQNAYHTGRAMGIKAGKALSFAQNTTGLAGAISAIDGAILRYRQNGAPHANQFFTESDHYLQRKLGACEAPMSS